jgi:hypothetical protein
LKEYFHEIIRSYECATRAQFPDSKSIIFKNPEYCFHIDNLIELTDDSRFIISVRDPRDQVTSEFEVGQRQLARGWPNAASASRDMSAFARTLNAYYAPVLASAANHPDRFIFIRYEELIRNFAATLSRLNAFTGMNRNQFDPTKPWPRMHADIGQDAPSYTRFYQQPFEPARIGRYRLVLSSDEISQVERETTDLMSRFGYAPDRR